MMWCYTQGRGDSITRGHVVVIVKEGFAFRERHEQFRMLIIQDAAGSANGRQDPGAFVSIAFSLMEIELSEQR